MTENPSDNRPGQSGTPRSAVTEAARLWAIRVGDARFDDWDAFAAWLESAPDHLTAYESALEEESWAVGLLARETTANHPGAQPPVPEDAADDTPSLTVTDRADDTPSPLPAAANDVMPPRRRWLIWGGAIAASIAAFGGWTTYHSMTGGQDIITGPGQKQSVQLADGSRIMLNGDTHLVISRKQDRHITMKYGEALFEVVHNEQKPFTVMVGETRLLDAGTVFNVIGTGGTLEVAVAEGAVIYQPGQKQIRLDAGDALSRDDIRATPSVYKADPDTVGGWQKGLLHYDDAPLFRVARDISRTIGQPIEVTEQAGALRFTGTLALGGPVEQALARAAPLLGVHFEPSGQDRKQNGWRMISANDRLR